MIVKCHDQREQATNRSMARKILMDKLDILVNGECSRLKVKEIKRIRTKDRYERRRKQNGDNEEGKIEKEQNSEDEEQDSDLEIDEEKYREMLKNSKIGDTIK
eukprot:403343616